jgi:diguanylate cyclase (GGDEF)-like protein
MPKGKPGRGMRSAPAVKPRRGRAQAPERRPPVAPPETGAKPARSQAMQLAAEVERLQRELAAARVQMAALEARADIDPLTNILNRRGFERELARSLAYVKRHGTSAVLLYVDLDGFKSVNDRHGHAAGDALLNAVVQVLNRHVRASDVVARLGGDEFVVLLWNCDGANAASKAAALEAAIARTTATHAGTSVSAGASVGVAELLPLDRPADTLERADRAMYARKAARSSLAPRSGERVAGAEGASRVRGEDTASSEPAPHPPRSQELARHPLPASAGRGK